MFTAFQISLRIRYTIMTAAAAAHQLNIYIDTSYAVVETRCRCQMINSTFTHDHRATL